MSAGLAPSLMLDLAAAHIEDHHRAARGRADAVRAAGADRSRLGRLMTAFTR